MFQGSRRRHHVEARSSQPLRYRLNCRHRCLYNQQRVADSPITSTIERGSAPVCYTFRYYLKRFSSFVNAAFRLQTLHPVFKSCVSMTELASCLQIFTFQSTKWHLVLQTGISDFNSARIQVIRIYDTISSHFFQL